MTAPTTGRSISPRTLLHLLWASIVSGGILLEVVLPPVEDWQWPFGLLAFPVAGAILLIRRPANPVGRLLAISGAAAGFAIIGGWLSEQMTDQAGGVLEALTNATPMIIFWGIVSLLFVFPNGLIPRRWSRWTYRVFTLLLLGVIPVGAVIRPGPLEVSGRINPLGFGPAWVGPVVDGAIVVLPVGALIGVATLFVRFRQSHGVERAQLVMFLAGAGFVLGLMAIISPIFGEYLGQDVFDVITGVVVILGLWALPVAVVAAILRYRLYAIDRIVSRSVTYVVVVSVLAVFYVLLVVILRGLLPVEGDLPVAATTLAVASLFAPLLRRVQAVVDRRFFRSRYDTSRVVNRVADELSHSVDLEEVTSRMAAVLREVLAPETMAVWLRIPNNDLHHRR